MTGHDPTRTAHHSEAELVESPVGLVEEFSQSRVTGWVAVSANEPPVKVSLQLGEFVVSTTYAAPSTRMPSQGYPLGDAATCRVPQTRRGLAPALPGPTGGRRNSDRQVCSFAFQISDLWLYVRVDDQITVRVDAVPLPIYGHGTYLSPCKSGPYRIADLADKFSQGFLLSQEGRIALSRRLDRQWQRQVMGLYSQTSAVVADYFGYDVFFIYGTLLGALREGTFIDHDVDFDIGYVSGCTNGPDAAAELVDIGITLIDHGLIAEAKQAALHISDPNDPDLCIDLFHTYFSGERLRFPFGVAGEDEFTRPEWHGTTEIAFAGANGRIPLNTERLVEHIYGTDWTRPKPGFSWVLDRTDSAPEGRLTEELRTKVHWKLLRKHPRYLISRIRRKLADYAWRRDPDLLRRWSRSVLHWSARAARAGAASSTRRLR